MRKLFLGQFTGQEIYVHKYRNYAVNTHFGCVILYEHRTNLSLRCFWIIKPGSYYKLFNVLFVLFEGPPPPPGRPPKPGSLNTKRPPPPPMDQVWELNYFFIFWELLKIIWVSWHDQSRPEHCKTGLYIRAGSRQSSPASLSGFASYFHCFTSQDMLGRWRLSGPTTYYFSQNSSYLRYHGSWIFKKNAKNLFFAVQIEKTEKNNLQKEWRKKLFYFLR